MLVPSMHWHTLPVILEAGEVAWLQYLCTLDTVQSWFPLYVQVYVLRLSPFYTAMGACLFTWNEDGRVLTKGPFQFRVVNSPMTAPGAYSSFQVSQKTETIETPCWMLVHWFLSVAIVYSSTHQSGSHITVTECRASLLPWKPTPWDPTNCNREVIRLHSGITFVFGSIIGSWPDCTVAVLRMALDILLRTVKTCH